MRFERIRHSEVPEGPPQSLSSCKKSGNQVFISGMVAWDGNMTPLGGNNAYEQARIAFRYIKLLMEAAGGCVDDVAKITIFTTDMRYQPDIWRARKEVFTGDFPCSTLVCVAALFKPELLVEIEAIGVIGASGGSAAKA